MKKYLVICIILCTFLLAACQAKNPEKSAKPKQSETVHLEKAKTLEIGITYKIGASKNPNAFYVKFIDDQHCVYMVDSSHYTQSDIDEMNRDEDSVDFYPYISFTIGEYTKQGDNYSLKPIQTVKVEFKDAKHAKDNIIATQKRQERDPQDAFIIKKVDGNYAREQSIGDFPLYQTNKKLPNSIDEFLAQYDYQPEELD